jgi:hypothetical protein
MGLFNLPINENRTPNIFPKSASTDDNGIPLVPEIQNYPVVGQAADKWAWIIEGFGMPLYSLNIFLNPKILIAYQVGR